MNKHSEYSIDIDCPPGKPRPGDLIDDVIEGTGLPKRETESRVFGAWVWNYTDVPNIDEIWEKHSEAIYERLVILTNTGVIRGSQMIPKPVHLKKQN